MQDVVRMATADSALIFEETRAFPTSIDPSPLVHLVEAFMHHPQPISTAFCTNFATMTQHRSQLYLSPHRERVAPHTVLLPVTFANRHFGHVVVHATTHFSTPILLPQLQSLIHFYASLLYSIEQQVLITSLHQMVTTIVGESLTRREHEILQALVRSGNDVAAQPSVVMHPKTVSKHLEGVEGRKLSWSAK